jgi:hypothetical protein
MRVLLCTLAALTLLDADAARADPLPSAFAVAEPIPVGRLTLYPLIANGPTGNVRVVPLARALRAGEVQIVDGHFGDTGEPVPFSRALSAGEGRFLLGNMEIEVGGPPEFIQGGGAVELRNRMPQPVLVLAGEVIVGGGQDRMLSRSQVLKPGALAYQPVFCVEHGRGHGESVRFQAVGGMADSGLRLRGLGWADQEAVWSWVASATLRLHAYSKTGTYRAVLDGSSTVSLHPYWDATLGALASRGIAPKMVGVAVALDGRLVSADLFATPELFREYSRELFEAAFVSAAEEGEGDSAAMPASEVEAQLRRGRQAVGSKCEGPLDHTLLADTLPFGGRALYTRYLPRSCASPSDWEGRTHR